MSLPSLKLLAEAIESKKAWAGGVLSDWVRCPSTLGNELSAQEYIENVLTDMGLEVRREPVIKPVIEPLAGYSPALIEYDNRPNIVGEHYPSEVSGQSLLVNGHVDVVSPEPTALWSSSPFEPKVFTDELGETWMQGRGAGDMKGGTVSALWAFEALRSIGLQPAAPVIFQSCIEEECTGNGSLSLLANGGIADACLIPEPFDQTLLAAQAGVLWFEVHILGKTTHVLGATQGVNAIEKAWCIYQYLKRELEAPANALETLPDEYRDIPHPVNLNLGVIHGGDWPSTVAGDCVMRLRMGLLPGTACAETKERINALVKAACEQDPWLTVNPPRVIYRGFKAEPCRFDVNSEFASQLSESHQEVMGEPPTPLFATCTTDVRFFNLYAGVPATCYGPKAVAIHGADERVSIDSMKRTALVTARFMTRWCGVEKRKRT